MWDCTAWLIVRVSEGVEVRALCCTVKFFHSDVQSPGLNAHFSRMNQLVERAGDKPSPQSR